MNILSEFAILRLFDIKHNKLSDIKKELNNILKIYNVWGLFVTIKRGQKIKEWPFDIHGCLGYYRINPIVKLTSSDIINHINRLVIDANTKDDRHVYFKNSVFEDSRSKIEITLMHSDLMNIDNNTGMIIKNNEKFDNTKYGLVVIDNNTKETATYLPHVFDKDIKWSKLKTSLISKADIKNNSNISFYAYNTIISETSISKLLLKKKFILSRLENIYSRLINIYNQGGNHKKIPYSIDREGFITYDNKQYVRNMSVLLDFIKLGDLFNESNIDTKDLYKYLKIFKTNNDKQISNNSGLAQSVASILPIFNIVNDKDMADRMYSLLYNRLKDGLLEPNFEWGQVMIALLDYNPNDRFVKRNILSMNIESVNDNDIDNDIDNIFRYNWYSQVLVSYSRIIQLDNSKNSKNSKNDNNFEKKVIDLIKNLLNSVYDIYNRINLSKYETNYLAVLFECLSGLRFVCRVYKIKTNLDDKIINVMYYLEKRYKNNLYYFKDNSSRIDITCHVINGYMNLLI